MTFQKELLQDYREFNTPELVALGDGHNVEAVGDGRVKIIMKLYQRKQIPGWMTDVLFVPKLAGNLFSVRAVARNQKVISFGHKYCWIRNKERQLVGSGSTLGKLYKLDCVVQKPLRESVHTAKESQIGEVELWHQRLAHVNLNQL